MNRSDRPRCGLLLLVAMILAAPATTRAAEPVGKKYALLIGVNRYHHDSFTKLTYAENDVAALAAVLRVAHYEVTLLTGATGAREAASRPTCLANIANRMTEILERVGPSDLVLVGFAGHGIQFVGDGDAFFCPQDADPGTGVDARKSLLSLNALIQQLDRSKAGVKFVLVDACPKTTDAKLGIDGSRTPKLPDGMAVLFSCSAGERSIEDPRLPHGLFFHHVLEALRGDGRDLKMGEFTWDDLQKYVGTHVAEHAQRLSRQSQKPSAHAGNLRDKPTNLIIPVQRLAALANVVAKLGPVDPATAERCKIPQAGQPQAQYVIESSVGDQMGLYAGDVVLSINGQKIACVSEAVPHLVNIKLGESIELEVLRDGTVRKLTGRYETPLTHTDEMRRTFVDVGRGDPAAMFHLAEAYRAGLGVTKNEDKWIDWLQKSADRGFPPAQSSLAEQYARGWATLKKSEEKALGWNLKAAEAGHPTAQVRLGVMYELGRSGVEKSDAKAAEWFRKAAEQGEALAQNHLAVMYLTARGGLEQSNAKALEWLNKAAAQGDANALFNLGSLYAGGRALPKSDEKAVEYYRRAAEGGFSKAQNALAVMYTNGSGGLPKSDEKAVEWLSKAASQGEVNALFNLAIMQEGGRGGLVKSDERAVFWYQLAAEKGHSGAQTSLALMYGKGRGGLEQSDAKAAEWFRKAAEQGVPKAQNSLGVMYAAGRGGLEKSNEKAVEWYRKAANLGYAPAQYNLGMMYERGVGGLPRSVDDAVLWYRKAADSGEEMAKKALQRLIKP